MFTKIIAQRCALGAAIALPFLALGGSAYGQSGSPNLMASYICRPVVGSETSNARMNTQGTALLCHPFAVRLHMDDGSMKVIGNVTSRPLPGPDFSKALTAQQFNDAWNTWVQQKLQNPHRERQRLASFMTGMPKPGGGANAAVRPFRISVQQSDLDELRSRIRATRWPDRETVDDESQGVPLATIQGLARYWATEYDWRTCEARLNVLPQYLTEIDGLDIHFIHVRSPHENAMPLIVTHGWPGSIIEQLKIIEPLDGSRGKRGEPLGCVPRGDPLAAGLRFLRKAGYDRLGYCSHRTRLARSDETPWLRALRCSRRRFGSRRFERYGQAGSARVAGHPRQSSRHRAGRRRRITEGRISRRRPGSLKTSGAHTDNSTRCSARGAPTRV